MNPKGIAGAKKAPLHLVPPALEIGAANALGEGAPKYGPYNWRDIPVDAMTYVGGFKRHLAAYIDGEDVDPESSNGKLHLEGMAACIAILLDATYSGTLIDNRPPKGAAARILRRHSKSAEVSDRAIETLKRWPPVEPEECTGAPSRCACAECYRYRTSTTSPLPDGPGAPPRSPAEGLFIRDPETPWAKGGPVVHEGPCDSALPFGDCERCHENSLT